MLDEALVPALQVRDLQGNQLRAAERAGEAHQEEGAIAGAD
jgi:hypothetical protein